MGVCTTASIAVDRFLSSDNTFNYTKLKEVAKKMTYDLNKIIEENKDILSEVLYNIFVFLPYIIPIIIIKLYF